MGCCPCPDAALSPTQETHIRLPLKVCGERVVVVLLAVVLFIAHGGCWYLTCDLAPAVLECCTHTAVPHRCMSARALPSPAPAASRLPWLVLRTCVAAVPATAASSKRFSAPTPSTLPKNHHHHQFSLPRLLQARATIGDARSRKASIPFCLHLHHDAAAAATRNQGAADGPGQQPVQPGPGEHLTTRMGPATAPPRAWAVQAGCPCI